MGLEELSHVVCCRFGFFPGPHPFLNWLHPSLLEPPAFTSIEAQQMKPGKYITYRSGAFMLSN
jgi:hypothetical protein